MDTNLLRSWLGLPPGDWPPPAQVLLQHTGSTSETVQERALAMMEQLRPHQLRHPELVTEGMNRLAQALIALEAEEFAANPRLESDGTQVPAASPALPVILDAEVVEAFPVLETLAREKARSSIQKKRTRPLEAAPVSIPPIITAPPPPVIADRRLSYRRLANLRAVRKGWECLMPFFGVPSRELLNSADVFGYLEASRNAKAAVQRLDSWPIVHGLLIRPVILHGASATLFRDLQKSQREIIAADWARAFAELQAAEASLTAALRSSKPKPSWRQRIRGIGRFSKSHPEWKIAIALVAVACVALYRTMR